MMNKPEKTIKYLERPELRDLCKVINSKGSIRDRSMFALMYHVGLRVGEAVTLELEDLKERGTVLLVHRLKGGKSGEYPLSGQDIKALRLWLGARGKMGNASGNPYIFITSRCGSGSMSRNNVQKAFSRYAEAAGLPKAKRHPHVLRHTCAVGLITNEVGIYDIKARLGHSKISSTEVYLQLADPEMRARQEKVSAAFEF